MGDNIKERKGKMKTFYGAAFVTLKELAVANIYHPIKLEYYKICQKNNENMKYGIEIVKKIYKNKQIQEKVLSITNIEEKQKKFQNY